MDATTSPASSGGSFESRLYLDLGGGYVTEDRLLCRAEPGQRVSLRADLPQGCRGLRFDPVEGCGCLVSDLRITCDRGLLSCSESNGFEIGGLYAFTSSDPQLCIDLRGGETAWAEVSAEVLPLPQYAWLAFCGQITALADSQKAQLAALEEKCAGIEQSRQDLEQLLEQRDSTSREALVKANVEAAQLQNQILQYEREHEEAVRLAEAYRTISNSRFWRMTKPMRALLDKAKRLFRAGRAKRAEHAAPASLPAAPVSQTPCITGHPIDPIETSLVSEPVRRLNLVTDALDDSSLLGGVATSLILATEFCNRCGFELRIITRQAEPNPMNYSAILKLSGIEPAKKLSFYSDSRRGEGAAGYRLEVSPSDVFLATSWWSAQAILHTTLRSRFFYILQEVEPFFYCHGGEHLLCSETLRNPHIDFLVNSAYLFDYFRQSEPNVTQNGCCFEPAFPKRLYARKVFRKRRGKSKLFFYARPNNPRNLFSVGVWLLDQAIRQGVLDPGAWDIYFAGQNTEPIVFCDGSSPIELGRLSWADYADFLSDVDIGLCLMYTPHPSYPPYDVACSGGVVLTNRYLNKTRFDACKNVLLCDLDSESFLPAFREAMALAADLPRRQKNYEESTICRSWQETLTPVVAHMKELIGDV